MIQRGARHLVFLGRSGASKPAAQESVEILRQLGAEVQVIRGDVAVLSDVKHAVAQVRQPIAGIIHAAMNLEVSSTEDDSFRPFAFYHSRLSGRKELINP